MDEVLLLLCVLPIVHGAVEIGTGNEDTSHYPPIVDLYNMEFREVPVKFCPDVDSRSRWRPPLVPKCELEMPNLKTPPIMINITTWWPALERQVLRAFECVVRPKLIRTYYSFSFVGYSETILLYNKSVSRQACADMVLRKLTPDNEGMEQRTDGVWITKTNQRLVKYSYLSHLDHYYNDYLFQEIKIAVNNEPPHLVQANTHFPVRCNVSIGGCETSEGWLQWNPSDFKTCLLKRGFTAFCALTGGHITCPGETLALSNIIYLHVCGLTIGSNDQQLFFTPDTNDIAKMNVTASLVPLAIREPVSIRSKRSTHRFGDGAAVAAQLEYLKEVVRENLTVVVFQLHKDFCQHHARWLYALMDQAETGNPTALVEAFYGPGYQARWEGDLLNIVKCEDVHYYQFLDSRIDCMKEWPVLWRDSNDTQEARLGYMTSGHEIRLRYTPIDCDKQTDYYFTYNQTTYSLTWNYHTYFPFLPTPAITTTVDIMPNISFKIVGAYSGKEFANSNSNDELRQDLAKARSFAQDIQSFESGEEIKEDNWLKKFSAYMWDEWYYYLVLPTGLVIGLVILLLFVKILVCLGCCNFRMREKKCCHKFEETQRNKVEIPSIAPPTIQQPSTAGYVAF